MKLLSGVIELKPGWFIRLPYPMTEMEMAHYRFGPLAIPLMLAGTGIAVAGQIQAGRAAVAQTQAQAAVAGARTEAEIAQARSLQNIANYNALVMEREAEATRQRARFGQKRQAERGARVKSALVADIAAAGGLGSPVAADLAAEQAAELELENLLVGFEGEVLAGRAETQAELDRLQAQIYGRRVGPLRQIGKITSRAFEQRARNLRTAALLGAGKTLLTGFGTAFA